MLQHEQALAYAEVPGQAEAYVGVVGGVLKIVLRTNSPPRLVKKMEIVVEITVLLVGVLLLTYC
jgi:hypothetical protein